jgi:hypothetical protein
MFHGSMLLYTGLSQWGLFVGIALIIFGWVEKRNHLVLAGQFTFLALGLLGLWMVLTHDMPAIDGVGPQLTKAVKAQAYFKGTVYFMALTAVSLILELFKIKYRKFLVYALVIFALMLFSMVVTIQQMSH